MKFIGLDLAWSPRNATGGAVLASDDHGATLVNTALLTDDRAIVAYTAQHASDGPAIIAVDAPLRVPNHTGRRLAEAEIGAAFGRYQAGAHPANRQRLAYDGVVRGEALVAALEARGFVHAPAVAAGVPVRQVVEVFPHPAMIAIFGLARTLKYKAKPKRSREHLLAEWQRYRDLLRALPAADPPLHGHEPLLAHDLTGMRGQRLKHYEDQVDALFCAYIALYAFRWGAARCRVFGTMHDGYIFTPVPPPMWNTGPVCAE